MAKKILLDNLSEPFSSPISVTYCNTFLCQLRGFTFRRKLGENEGLLLAQTRDSRLDSAIHMLAVFTSLAVFWIDSNHMIVHKTLALPWRFAYISPRPAKYVLELHPSRLDIFQIGQKVGFHNA